MVPLSPLRSYRVNRIISNTCIGTAVGVFGAWNYSQRGVTYNILSQQQQFLKSITPAIPDLPSPTRVREKLQSYFLLSSRNPTNYPSWIGAAFSHHDTFHIFFNLLTWSNFAPALFMLPTRHFATLIFGSAITSSAAFLQDQRRKGRDGAGLGSSGIVSGLMATVTMFAPTARVSLFGLLPLPLWVATGAYFVVDTYMMRSGSESSIGHSAHVGGATFGLLYYTLFLRRFGGVFGRR